MIGRQISQAVECVCVRLNFAAADHVIFVEVSHINTHTLPRKLRVVARFSKRILILIIIYLD